MIEWVWFFFHFGSLFNRGLVDWVDIWISRDLILVLGSYDYVQCQWEFVRYGPSPWGRQMASSKLECKSDVIFCQLVVSFVTRLIKRCFVDEVIEENDIVNNKT